MQAIQTKLPGLIGGSADLNPSTNTELKAAGNFENPEWRWGICKDRRAAAGVMQVATCSLACASTPWGRS